MEVSFIFMLLLFDFLHVFMQYPIKRRHLIEIIYDQTTLTVLERTLELHCNSMICCKNYMGASQWRNNPVLAYNKNNKNNKNNSNTNS